MKTKPSFIAITLATLMLLGALTACNGGGGETNTDPSLSTESENGAFESTADTEAPDAGNAEGSGSPDTTPLALTAVEDLFPDLKEYEKVASRENFKPTTTEVFEEKIEAENYNTTTISALGTLSSKEYSGRVMVKVITTGEPAQGWDYVYSIS